MDQSVKEADTEEKVGGYFCRVPPLNENSSIPALYHTFMEIDHEIISTVILLPSADSFKHSRRVIVRYK